MTPSEALAFAVRTLAPAQEIDGFADHIRGELIITQWTKDPYTRATYAVASPGTKRSGPRQEGNVIIAGEAFNTEFTGALAGAYLSGKATADVAEAIIKNRLVTKELEKSASPDMTMQHRPYSSDVRIDDISLPSSWRYGHRFGNNEKEGRGW